jgi:hypothetical protein
MVINICPRTNKPCEITGCDGNMCSFRSTQFAQTPPLLPIFKTWQEELEYWLTNSQWINFVSAKQIIQHLEQNYFVAKK